MYYTPPAYNSSFAWYPNETVPIFTRGQKMYSNNGQYLLEFQQSDGNLVLSKVSSGQVLWSIQKTGGSYMKFHKDGNFLMYNGSNQYIWSSDIYSAGGDFTDGQKMYFILQDDGNLVFEWNGLTYTDVVGATGTGGGIVSSHFGSLKL